MKNNNHNIFLDIGKTNVKLYLLNKENIILEFKTKQSIKKFDKNINTLDSTKLIKWLKSKLNKITVKYKIDKFVCATHGSGQAFIGYKDEIIIDVSDYESNFNVVNESYRKIIPKFNESLTPLLSDGLNLGKQIHYFNKYYSNLLKKTKHILTYPQFISWKLCNNYNSEISYLGCHTHLWNFKKNKFSTLAKKLNVDKKIPIPVPAWKKIGFYEINKQKINILNGVHDSNASYLFFKNSKLKQFTLISTGTWHIIFNQKTTLNILNPNLDMLSNIDVFKNKVPTMRFMGGREFEVLTKLLKVTKIDKIDIKKINFKEELLIYPSFANAGPFKINKNFKIKKITQQPNKIKYLYICIYLSFVLNFCLSKMKSSNQIIIDGPIVQNNIVLEALSSLRGDQNIFKNKKIVGTATGAINLFNIKQKNIINLNKVRKIKNTELEILYKQWLATIKKKNLINN